MRLKFTTAGSRPKAQAFAGRAAGLMVIAVAMLVLTGGAAHAVSTCANEAFRQGPGGLLPDCRAYEQVSPPDKNGGDVGANPGGGYAVALSGQRTIFDSNAEFAGSVYGGQSGSSTKYISVRTDGGWSTAAMAPAVKPAANPVDLRFSSADLHRSFLSSNGLAQLDPPFTSDDTLHIYLRDNLTGIVSPFFDLSPDSGFGFSTPVASFDTSHIAFVSSTALTDDEVPNEIFAKVYERVGNDIRLVSIRPDGTSFDHAFLGSGEDPGATQFSTIGAMSSDGRHIFFNNSTYYFSPKEIYRRTDGTTTVLATPSKRSSPDPSGVQTKIYRLATMDGRRLFFTSAELLTDDANTGPTRAGSDLYRYDVEADELIDISATDGGDGAQVPGVIGTDDAGDRVYYVAYGQVVPGQGSSSGTAPNLYLWEDDGTPDGSTRFIATLSAADGSNWDNLNTGWTARVSDDGSSLLFQSAADIPGYENGGVAQLYHYTADANGGPGLLRCVSCNPNGDTPLGPPIIPNNRGASFTQRWEHPHAMSDDGRLVFFNTPDALTPRDSNGKVDPYMWDRDSGQLSLLSTGTHARPSVFQNASASGDDVFIVTAESLVPQDIDDLYDMYDVRVGGGFPVLLGPPTCEDDECQGSGADTPATGDTTSSSLRGAGNVKAGARTVIGLKRLSKVQRRRLAQGRSIGVRARVSRATKVHIVVRAATRGGWTVVARGAKRPPRAGIVRVRVRLSRSAQRRLGSRGSLRLSVQAKAPGGRPKSLTITLRGTR
jgi:hypothetical protein